MNQNLERGLQLYQLSRHELAENEFRQALAAEPHNAYAHSLLGLCLLECEQFQEATEEAKQAIHLEPDFAFTHYALARVLSGRNHFSEALTTINEAIRLDPEDADFYSLLASILLQESRWQDALNAAEQGLQFNPEHVGCTNLRAMAMVKLGRKADAGRTIDSALAKNPDNSLTHANQGWTFLEKGEPAKAAEHFREALRLDPTNEWARQGIIEALKAKNFIYAIMLKYFLWMAKFSRRGQWAILLAGYFGNRILGTIAQSNPEFAPWILPLQILYIVFALLTWLAYPFFNLLLRLNKFGRLVLSREQTIATNWFGLCLLLALFGLTLCLIRGFMAPWIQIATVFGFLLLPLSGIFRCQQGWPRNVMMAITIAIAALGIGSIVARCATPDRPDNSNALMGVFVLGVIASTWIVNILIMQRQRR
jgi:tetratricopeptide (TPR) repeat protein